MGLSGRSVACLFSIRSVAYGVAYLLWWLAERLRGVQCEMKLNKLKEYKKTTAETMVAAANKQQKGILCLILYNKIKKQANVLILK